MKFGPYSFEKQNGVRARFGGLAIPALVAAGICVGLTVFWVKKLRATPEPEKKSDWNINWVELTDFKKTEAPKSKEQK